MRYSCIIKILDILVTFDTIEVLSGASFEVNEGEMTSIIGPNGSGKTTLLRCLYSALKPSSGAVYIEGKKISELTKEEISKLIAAMPAERREDLKIKVFDVVLMGRIPHVKSVWWEGTRDEAVALEAMKMLDVAHLARRRFDELSSGERRRVMIAKALAQEPRVLLLDEPVSYLDLKYQLDVMNFLKDLCRKGITVISASHNIELAARFSDKLVMLNCGKIVASGPPKNVITAENLKKVYGVDVMVKWDDEWPSIIPKFSKVRV